MGHDYVDEEVLTLLLENLNMAIAEEDKAAEEFSDMGDQEGAQYHWGFSDGIAYAYNELAKAVRGE